MKFSRRKFLLSGAALASVAVPGAIAAAPLLPRPETLITEIVRYHLPFKDIDPADLADFARHYVRQDRTTGKAKLTLLRLSEPFVFSPALRKSLPDSIRIALDSFERRVLTMFMLSTDFFEYDDPFTPKLTYNGYYDPGQSCSYPLVET